MNFKVSKNVLYNSLQLVSKAISSNSPLPSLSGIKIDVNNTSIILTGSDAEISIKKVLNNNDIENLNLVVLETGSIVIEAKYLLEIVRKIDSSDISFEIVDGSLVKIVGKATEYIINGIRSSEYPLIDFNKPSKSFSIKSSTLQKLISQTTFATSDKEIRQVLTGVNFNLKNGILECVATDSYRLAKKTVEIDSDLTLNITIPAKSLNEINKSIESDKDIEIAISDKIAQFYIDNAIIQTRLIEGSYPETNRLIPTVFKLEITLDAREMISAIDRAIFIKNEGVSIVKLSMNKDEIIISSKSQEVGSLEEVIIPNKFNGEGLDISFSGNYMLDAIRNINATKIKINFSGEMKPFIIENIDDNSIIQLVLPVRTYN